MVPDGLIFKALVNYELTFTATVSLALSHEDNLKSEAGKFVGVLKDPVEYFINLPPPSP